MYLGEGDYRELKSLRQSQRDIFDYRELIDYRELNDYRGMSDYRELGGLGKKPSTPWRSRAVPQPSTTLALHRLAMEFEWDPAFSMQYGRRLIDYRFPIPRFNKCEFPIVDFSLSGTRSTLA